ncbi:MAG: ATP-binding cassette domain-containing protein [Muribaculaceae bacterium]|nr:ATP-binding cassette domain-containing protein [Muribaculaceae bacterium]MDE6320723.1 ATP-binding cassette domain-containing protein [Muribaculaceae bacterium]
MDTIELKEALPQVFRDDPAPESQIWLTDVEFRRPNLYMVAAESGKGKSSMCSYIYGNRNDYMGQILFNGEDIRNYDIMRWSEIRRSHLALLPQELRLFPELSAMDNIRLKNRLTDFKTEEEILMMLDMLGIKHKANQLAAYLSVGQQQRVAIVRSLCQPFDFIMLDEPVSHLDAGNNRIAADLIVEEAKRQQAGVITTSVGNHLALVDPITLRL